MNAFLLTTNISFENFVPGEAFIGVLFTNCIKFTVSLFILILFLKLFFKRLKLWKQLKIFTLVFKFNTCLFAVFTVFFFNFEENKIMLMPTENMLLSTLLVGALGAWELFSIIADFLESFDN